MTLISRVATLALFAVVGCAAGAEPQDWSGHVGTTTEALGAPSFAPAVAHRLADGSPSGVAVADFDGDGAPDLATTVTADGVVEVRLNAGDGTFAGGTRFAAGSEPVAVTVADFDGDLIPDLAVANHVGNSVSILLGNGDGTFGAPTKFPAGGVTDALVTGKFKGDGPHDIATGAAGSGNRAILLGAGDGTFDPPVPVAFGENVGSLAVGDVNLDGEADLVSTGGQHLVVLLGHGDGTFDPPVTTRICDGPLFCRFFEGYVAIADMNGDGKPDLVTARDSRGGGGADVWLGKGDGTFLVGGSAGIIGGAAQHPNGLVVADANGDGKLDAILSYPARTPSSGGFVEVYLGKGDGTLQAPSRSAAGSPNGGLATGDFDLDGRIDIALTGNQLNVLFGKGDGTFAAPVLYGTLAGRNPFAIATADFDADGHADLVTANYGNGGSIPSSVSLLLGKGGGAFQPTVNLSVGKNLFDVKAADFNNDGKVDLIFVEATSASNVFVLLGKGDGTFGAPIYSAAAAGMTTVAVADIDGDGKLDLVTNYFLDSFRQGVAVSFGLGNGSFKAPVSYGLGTGTTLRVATADLDRDGKVDVVAVNVYSSSVVVLLNKGGGGLGAPVSYPTGIGAFVVASGDVNGDGNPDVVVAGDKVGVLLGKGDGTLLAASVFPTGGVIGTAFGIALADVNLDGLLDVAIDGNGVQVLAGIGGGKLGGASLFALPDGGNGRGIAAVNLNGTKKPDLAIAVGDVDEVAILLNNTK